MSHVNLIFEVFKSAAAAALRPAETSGSATQGDSMKSFRAQTRNPPQWTAPNPNQATPNDNNPIASQKTAPPPPVQ